MMALGQSHFERLHLDRFNDRWRLFRAGTVKSRDTKAELLELC